MNPSRQDKPSHHSEAHPQHPRRRWAQSASAGRDDTEEHDEKGELGQELSKKVI